MNNNEHAQNIENERLSAEQNMELLSKLLNSNKSGKNNEFEAAKNGFYAVLEKDFKEKLRTSILSIHNDVYYNIKEIIDDLEIFSCFPALIGKTQVGIFSLDHENIGDFLSYATDQPTVQKILLNTSLPCLLCNETDDVRVTNDVENQISLTEKEYSDTNNALFQYGIDIRKILNSYSFKSAPSLNHIGMAYFPQNIQFDSPFTKYLINKLDHIIIITPQTITNEDQEIINKIRSVSEKQNISITFLRKTSDKNSWEQFTYDQNPDTVSNINILELLSDFNHPLDNTNISAQLELIYYKIIRFYEHKLNKNKNNLKLLTKDNVFNSSGETRKTLENISAALNERQSQINAEKGNIMQSCGNLLEKAKIYEDQLKVILYGMNPEPVTRINRSTQKCWSDLFLLLIDLNLPNKAKEYFSKLQTHDQPYLYIYRMILNDKTHLGISTSEICRLSQEKVNEFIAQAEIRLKEHLKLTENDCINLVRIISEPQTADEFYYRAAYLERTSNNNVKAEKYYRYALHSGKQEAGRCLYELVESQFHGIDIRSINPGDNEPEQVKDAIKALKSLSDEMIPEANFALGIIYQRNVEFSDLSNLYFKLAATQGHIESIKILAQKEYNKIKSNVNKSGIDNFKDYSDANKCIRIFEYVLSKENNNDDDIKEKIGNLYHFIKDDIRALEYWKQCTTKTAYYGCGMLYFIGQGSVERNFTEAKKYLKLAKSMGHEKAGKKYQELLEEIKSNKNQTNNSIKTDNYSSRIVKFNDKTESGGCFITSAVCKTLNKPDDCDELMTFRAYRDKQKNNHDIASLIEEYYRIAPQIVAKIDQEANAENIYRELWENDISKAYLYIKKGDFKTANSIYINMTVNLCHKYQIDFHPGILENIQNVLN